MQNPFGGPFGGPRGGFGRHGHPFGGHHTPPTPEQEAFFAEAHALRQQLAATLSAAQNDPAILAQVKTILAQARIALATLASQPSNATPTTNV